MTGKFVPQTDCDQHLALFCEGRSAPSYAICANNRGVFCCLKDKSVVARGLPYPLEYTAENFSSQVRRVPFEACRVTRSIEGPVIIVFHHKDQWYLSTNRKLNAFKSYWADPKSSFGLMFAYGVFKKLERVDLLELTDTEVIKKELDQMFDRYLDKANRYIFIQPPSYNERLVTLPLEEHPAPVHVATFAYRDIKPSPGHDRLTKIEGQAQVPFATTPTEYKLPDPTSCDLYRYVCDLANKVNPYEAQGVLIEAPDGIFIKVLNSEYHDLLQIRGTVPSLKARYMQLRKDPALLAQFVTNYQEVDSKAIERQINEVCSILETVWLLTATRTPPDHIGTFLGHKGYIVESIALSKVLYANLLQQRQVLEAIQEVIRSEPYTPFQRLSVTNTHTFNTLTNKIKFQTTKARYAVKDDIESQIEFLNSLDVK